jgi:hypothetical protein
MYTTHKAKQNNPLNISIYLRDKQNFQAHKTQRLHNTKIQLVFCSVVINTRNIQEV